MKILISCGFLMIEVAQSKSFYLSNKVS